MLRRASMAQLLEAPVLEPPDGVDDVEELVDVLDDSVFLLSLELELLDDDSLSLFFALPPPPPLLEYRSEYQPPPLRMKPAPPDTWRLAVA